MKAGHLDRGHPFGFLIRVQRELLSSLICTISLLTTGAAQPPGSCTPPNFPLPKFGPARFNVRDFGAIGNGIVNDTSAINRGIEKCNNNGGGDLFFPNGTYSAASIHLKSNVRFVLENNAVITGAPDGYDPPEPNQFEQYQDFGHSHFHNALMWGDQIENFGIVGGHVSGGHIIEGEPGSQPVGDKVIAIKSSRNLLFENITHDRGGHFVYLLNDCDNVTIANVVIKKSRDGVNLVSCKNVQVHDCNFTGCGDDTLALKSDYALGRKIDSENIYAWNCYFETACNALQIGSESVGDFRNVNFWNIRIGRAWRAAIGITTVHGGTINDVNYRNITVKNAACPIFLRVGSKLLKGEPNTKPGTIRNLAISNLTVTDCKSGEEGWPRTSFISGRPESRLDQIRLENIKITYKGGGTKEEAELKDPYSKQESSKWFGPLPAAGFYIREVNGLTLKDVELKFERRDSRPLIAAFNVKDLRLEGLKSEKNSTAEILRMENVDNLSVSHSPGLKDRLNENVASILEE
jgi:Glycosyl hydrolases family 28